MGIFSNFAKGMSQIFNENTEDRRARKEENKRDHIAKTIDSINSSANHEIRAILSDNVMAGSMAEDSMSAVHRRVHEAIVTVIESANAELAVYNAQFEYEYSTEELRKKCEEKLSEIRAVEKDELREYVLDYLDELEEEGYRNPSFVVADDFMSVEIRATTPESIPMTVVGRPAEWTNPYEGDDDADFFSTLHPEMISGSSPSFDVTDNDFKLAIRHMIRAIRATDWSGDCSALTWEYKADGDGISPLPNVKQSGDGEFIVSSYESFSCEKRFEFVISLDHKAYANITSRIFNQAIQNLKDSGFTNVRVNGDKESKTVEIHGVDTIGMHFRISCSAAAENCSIIACSDPFRRALLCLTKAVPQVDWIANPDGLKWSLMSAGMLFDDDQLVEKTGLCTFATKAMVVGNIHRFGLEVRIDRDDYKAGKERLKAEEEARKEELQHDFSSRLIDFITRSLEEDNWRASKDEILFECKELIESAKRENCLISELSLDGYATQIGETVDAKMLDAKCEKANFSLSVSIGTDAPVTDEVAFRGSVRMLQIVLAANWHDLLTSLVEKAIEEGWSYRYFTQLEGQAIGEFLSEGVDFILRITPATYFEWLNETFCISDDEASIDAGSLVERGVEPALRRYCLTAGTGSRFHIADFDVQGIGVEELSRCGTINAVLSSSDSRRLLSFRVAASKKNVDCVSAFSAAAKCASVDDFVPGVSQILEILSEYDNKLFSLSIYGDTLYVGAKHAGQHYWWKIVELGDESVNGESASVDEMSGIEFEEYCANLLRKNGYEDVEVTCGSGDQGIDVLATKDFVKYGIQCKCYSSPVGNKAIQEAYAGKLFYGCHVAIVLTNNVFTPSAIDLADKTGVILWDKNMLAQLMGA